jgi:hypothetical protein
MVVELEKTFPLAFNCVAENVDVTKLLTSGQQVQNWRT